MRLVAFLAAAALIVAFTVALGTVPRHTEAQTAQTSAISGCAQVMDAAVPGDHCSQSSLDGTPGTTVSHLVLAHACGGADLHIVRYLPNGSNYAAPLVATYCG
jgi:hypothetical protein